MQTHEEATVCQRIGFFLDDGGVRGGVRGGCSRGVFAGRSRVFRVYWVFRVFVGFNFGFGRTKTTRNVTWWVRF